MLDFDSEDIDGMDDDAGDEQEPPPIGHRIATSSHDIYMVDTPKENDDEEREDAGKDSSLDKQPKRWRRRRSKSRLDKNNDNNARENNTPVDSRGNDDHIDPAAEHDETTNGEHSTDPISEHGDAEDKAHQPPSGEENSPDEDAHTIPERHLEQENLCRRLITTARSLKKQKQRLKVAQNTLSSRWNKVLDNEEKYGGSYHTKSYPKRKLLPEFDNEALEPTHPNNQMANWPDQPPCYRDRAANNVIALEYLSVIVALVSMHHV